MAWPVVIAANGIGLAVRESDNRFGQPYDIAENGIGRPVVFVDDGPALPVKRAYVFANSEASALVTRFTVDPDYDRKVLIDTLIGDLKAAGVWPKLDAFYVLAAHDAQAGRLNWIANQYNLTAVNDPSFTVDRGFTGNGTSSYLDTNFNPATAGGKFAQDDAHLGVFPITTANEERDDIGNGNSCIRSKNSSGTGKVGGRLNQGSTTLNAAGTVSTAIGHTVFSRSGSTEFIAYRDGASLGANAATSAAPNSSTILVCSGRVASFSTKQIAAAHFGSALTAGEVSDLYDILNTYLTAVGAV